MSALSSRCEVFDTLEERLAKLNAVERKIILIMQHAGHALEEMSKDRPSQKQADHHTHNFRLILREVELEMNAHINYLNQISTGLPYEGTVYAESVDLNIALDRLASVRHLLKYAE